MRYLTSLFSNTFDHPLLAFMIVVALLFGGSGLLIDVMGWKPVAAAFGGVYAILTLVLALGAYSALFVVKQVSQYRNRSAPSSD